MNVYERVAAEYYDRKLHPTCHNLRVASDFGFELMAEEFFALPGPLLEVGVGKSFLYDHPLRRRQLVIGVDLNPGMLATASGHAVAGDATSLPFRAASFCGAYGSLIDPFNIGAAHAEVARVLSKGSLYVFTVPDVRWVRHNQESSRLPEHTAGFTLQTGEIVLLPSFVFEVGEQVELLRTSGFSNIKHHNVPLSVIAEAELSSRFLRDDGSAAVDHIVTVYVAQK